jgi:hypothetical protein
MNPDFLDEIPSSRTGKRGRFPRLPFAFLSLCPLPAAPFPAPPFCSGSGTPSLPSPPVLLSPHPPPPPLTLLCVTVPNRAAPSCRAPDPRRRPCPPPEQSCAALATTLSGAFCQSKQMASPVYQAKNRFASLPLQTLPLGLSNH